MLIKNIPEVLQHINELDELAMRRSRLYNVVCDILNSADVYMDKTFVEKQKEKYGDLYIKGILSHVIQVDPDLIEDDLVKELAENLTVLDDNYYNNMVVKAFSRIHDTYIGCAHISTKAVDRDYVDFCKSPKVTGAIPACPRLYYSPKALKIAQLWIHDEVWMTISPNEVYTMEEQIKHAKGRVLTCGLGIGYFAIMAAAKPEVSSVTVIENNESVIRIFEEAIKRLFDEKITSKVEIKCCDAYKYLYDLADGSYDYCFIDLWQGVLDTEHYFKAVHATAKFKRMRYEFWIEDSFISRFREEVLAAMANTAADIPLNPFIFPFVNNVIIGSVDGVDKWLQSNSLRSHIHSTVRKISREAMDQIE